MKGSKNLKSFHNFLGNSFRSKKLGIWGVVFQFFLLPLLIFRFSPHCLTLAVVIETLCRAAAPRLQLVGETRRARRKAVVTDMLMVCRHRRDRNMRNLLAIEAVRGGHHRHLHLRRHRLWSRVALACHTA